MAVRPTFTKNLDKTRGKFSTGKYAVGICHRSGFKVPYRRLKFEPGTNYLVDISENDGEHSLTADALNFTPEKKIERIALRWSFPDVQMSIGTIVSADHLALPANVSTNFMYIDYSALSVSGFMGLDFSESINSMYYPIIFVGI